MRANQNAAGRSFTVVSRTEVSLTSRNRYQLSQLKIGDPSFISLQYTVCQKTSEEEHVPRTTPRRTIYHLLAAKRFYSELLSIAAGP